MHQNFPQDEDTKSFIKPLLITNILTRDKTFFVSRKLAFAKPPMIFDGILLVTILSQVYNEHTIIGQTKIFLPNLSEMPS
jgi:hypothetical protein